MNNAELGQVFTSPVVADYMVKLFSVDNSAIVLDPCFGGGAFLRALEDAGYSNVTGCEIDKYWYDKACRQYGNFKLVLGDFLKVNSDVKYDGIIMNPPYIRHEKINGLLNEGITKETLLSDQLYSCLPKTANMYMYFIVKAIELLKNGGEMVVIFPSSWMTARGGKKFKQYIQDKTDITDQVDVYGEVFIGEALVEVSILKMVKRENRDCCRCVRYKVSGDKLIEDGENDDEATIDFPVLFSEYASVRRGLTTGYNFAFINPQIEGDASGYLKPIISSPKAFSGYNTDNAILDMLLCIQEDEIDSDVVKQYIEFIEKKIVDSGEPKTYYELIRQSKPWYKLSSFNCDGIIFSYFVRNDMRFSLNTKGAMIRDNFYIIKPKEEVNIFLLVSLLNNYYTYYQLETKGKKYGAGLLKIQRYDIEGLMFPDFHEFSAEMVDKLIDYGRSLVKTNESRYIDLITEVLSDQMRLNNHDIISAYNMIKNKRLERV